MAINRYSQPLTQWGLLWGLPNTLLGLLLALFSLSIPSLREGVLLCRSNRGAAHFLLARRGYLAMTLGRVVLTVGPLPLATWIHEIEHTRQTEVWGPFFIPAYLYCLVRHGYEENPFEKAAVRVAEEFRADYPDRADELV